MIPVHRVYECKVSLMYAGGLCHFMKTTLQKVNNFFEFLQFFFLYYVTAVSKLRDHLLFKHDKCKIKNKSCG